MARGNKEYTYVHLFSNATRITRYIKYKGSWISQSLGAPDFSVFFWCGLATISSREHISGYLCPLSGKPDVLKHTEKGAPRLRGLWLFATSSTCLQVQRRLSSAGSCFSSHFAPSEFRLFLTTAAPQSRGVDPH